MVVVKLCLVMEEYIAQKRMKKRMNVCACAPAVHSVAVCFFRILCMMALLFKFSNIIPF